MLFRRLTIRRKLFLTIIATVVATITFFAVAVYWNTRSGISEYILAAEVARLDTVAEALADVYDFDAAGWPDLAEDRRAFDRLVRENLITSINPQRGVYNRRLESEGRASGGDGRSEPDEDGKGARNEGQSERPPGARNSARDRQNIRGRLSLVDQDKNFIVGGQLESKKKGYHPIVVQSQGDGEVTVGYLSMAMPMLDQRAADLLFEHNQIRMLTITGLLALILSILASFMLSRVLVSPIRELLAGAQKLSDGMLGTRLAVTAYDEIGELQSQFNKLANTLETNERKEREWISDTSHELQTPLAILRAEIEALQDGVRQSDEKTLATLHDSVTRLSKLVRDISSLSQAREGIVSGILNDENFSELVEESANRTSSLLSDQNLKLELDVEPDLIVSCDRLRIGQLLDNLLSNSVRYTDAGGKIRLRVSRKRNRVIMLCEDTAPCPPEESISKLFDRFYRNEKSRSRRSGGSGLGLPICKAIVLAHDGQILAEPSELGGLKIVVILPVQNPWREK
jgi:two-component system sensor histidine kinase BaeS